MENKKNPKVDLERYRGLFFATALTMVLLLVYLVINYKKENTINAKLYSASQSEFQTEFEPEIGLAIKQKVKPKAEKIVPVKDETEIPDTSQTELPDENTGTQKQNTGKSSKHDPLRSAEIMPEYPGGTAALKRDLAKVIRLPNEISSGKVSGTVYVQFVVTNQGEVDELEIKKSLHRQLDKEVIQALKSVKRFKPATQNGKPVAVYFILPLSFNL